MKSFIYLFLFPVIILTGCRTVLPPVRPVAGLYPTVVLPCPLDNLVPISCTEQQITAWLDSIGLYPQLKSAGMQNSEIMLVRRGLRERGYAEIDTRRAGLPFLWIRMLSQDGNNIEITGAFYQKPSAEFRPGISLQGFPVKQEMRAIPAHSPYEKVARAFFPVSIWLGTTPDGHPLEVRKISTPSHQYWEIQLKCQ